MANCTNCGKPLKEGVKFCTSCGAAVKSGAAEKSAAPAKTAAPEKPVAAAKTAAPAKTAAAEKPAAPDVVTYAAPDVVKYAAPDDVVSTAGWFGTIFVLAIPIIGLVLYFVWAFGSGNLNRRNYCRASLLLMAISLLVSIISAIYFYSVIRDIVDLFM